MRVCRLGYVKGRFLLMLKDVRLHFKRVFCPHREVDHG